MPIIQHLIAAYKLWHSFLTHFPKTSRYTLGGKIDSLFLEMVEFVVAASFTGKKDKLQLVRRAAMKLDALKFFLQIAWEVKVLDSKKYAALSEPLDGIGKMLGGWLRKLETETPPATTGGEQRQ